MNIIPKNNTNDAIINREELLAALRRSRVLASEMTPVRMRMSNEGVRLTVTLTDGSTSVEDLDAKFTGEDITVAFNSEFLADGVDACGSEEVSISTSVPHKPAIIKPVGNEDYLYLLMPQRL
jgi:DNA polymerase-3 subunit beta